MDAEAIEDLFRPIGRVGIRRMFGGHGIYIDALIIALEADGAIWMKSDAETAATFDASGCRSFTYEKNGKPYAMSYRALPEAAYEDADELRDWVSLARQAAVRAASKRR